MAQITVRPPLTFDDSLIPEIRIVCGQFTGTNQGPGESDVDYLARAIRSVFGNRIIKLRREAAGAAVAVENPIT